MNALTVTSLLGRVVSGEAYSLTIGSALSSVYTFTVIPFVNSTPAGSTK